MGRIKLVAIGAIKQVCVLYAAVSFLDLDVIQAAVLVAMLLRVALLLWALRHGIIIDSEGVEYARLAQNLRAGRGYMGIFNNGIQLNFPPLYPLLIAGLSFLLPSFELSARVINVVLGALLVVPMFKLAERIYSRKVASLVAVLVAFHPLLAARSVLCCSETIYLTFLMSGVYYVIKWIEEEAVKASIFAGVFFGLAYLVRPEAFLIVGAIAVAVLLSTFFVRNRRPLLIGVLSLVGVFAFAASPYVAFLSKNSGKFRVEAKGSLSYAWGTKMRAGMSYNEAATKIRDDLSGEGVFMKSYNETLKEASYTPRDLILYLLSSAPRNVKRIYEALATFQTQGAPVLFILAVIGLLRTAWDRRRLVNEGILLVSGLTMVLVLLSVQAFWPRFFHPFMALLLLWGGKGADELYHWSHDTVASISLQRGIPKRAGITVQWIAIVLVFALSLRAVLGEMEFRDEMLTDRKTAGQWLAQHWPGPKWVMATSLIPAYYADGSLMYLPYASSDLALRYIAKKKPDFIVLLEYSEREPPYLAQWFEQGIPDQSAELIYDEGDSQHERVKIYRWGRHLQRPSQVPLRKEQPQRGQGRLVEWTRSSRLIWVPEAVFTQRRYALLRL